MTVFGKPERYRVAQTENPIYAKRCVKTQRGSDTDLKVLCETFIDGIVASPSVNAAHICTFFKTLDTSSHTASKSGASTHTLARTIATRKIGS